MPIINAVMLLLLLTWFLFSVSQDRDPEREMNMESSEDFTMEHEEEDRSGGEDVGTSTRAASQTRAARISRRLTWKVACTTVEMVQRQDPDSNEEYSSWEE